MKMKRFILTFAAIAAICAASAAGADEARHFPAPSTVSPEMAAAVDKNAGELWYSEPKSVEEWNKITGGYTEWAAPHAVETAKQLGVTITEEKIAGVTVRTLTPKTIDDDKKDKIIYYIHGGGYVFGDGVAGTLEGTLMAAHNNYRVVAVDYRLAPKHPYPAAIDDAFAVYKELVKKYGAQNIAVLGTSTGGAMTLILALQCIEGGVPVPGALISGTPWSEMDKIGDSYVTNEGVDNILGTYDHLIKASAEVYANGADLKDPLISPVYAKSGELAQFPPTLLVTGTRDLFLSNTVRMHKLLLMNGAEAELLVYEALSHAQYYLVPDAPETADHHKLMDMFLDEHFLKKN